MTPEYVNSTVGCFPVVPLDDCLAVDVLGEMEELDMVFGISLYEIQFNNNIVSNTRYNAKCTRKSL